MTKKWRRWRKKKRKTKKVWRKVEIPPITALLTKKAEVPPE
jgi:hypothetical protein